MTDPQTSPRPVELGGDLWDLRASPQTVEAAARAWRELAESTETAEETVSRTARAVLDGEGWVGDTAESYHDHQRRLTSGLRELAERARKVAATLEEIASLLRINQEVLDRERERLAGVPATRDPELTFHPTDEEQWQLVADAIQAAHEIRERVDGQLADQLGVLSAAEADFTALAEAWAPRTIGMLNLNIGQGYENTPRNSAGTDHGDIGAIAQVIADADVDVVTIQEMFGQEADDLERELRERTGDEWTVYFGQASEKVYWSDGFRPRGFHEPFGNAIAVRHGGPVEDSSHVATHKLDQPGSTVSTPSGTVADGEGRSAVEVELRLNTG